MEKNLYYRKRMRRETLFIDFFIAFFNQFGSGARLLLEVFSRKNFGERYFRLSKALYLAIFLAILPVAIIKIPQWLMTQNVAPLSGMNGFNLPGMTTPMAEAPEPSLWNLYSPYIAWYLYLIAFVYVSFLHKRDLLRNPSVFDFAKYSLSTGVFNAEFDKVLAKINLPYFKKDRRLIECVIEPGIYVVIGVFFAIMGQYVGFLIIICGFIYSMSYFSAYRFGDDFVMNIIDEMICNRELESSFVLDKPATETSGFEWRGQRPEGMEARRELLPNFYEDQEIVTAK